MTGDVYVALKSIHILLIATWFGIDLGVAYCGVLLRNRQAGGEARQAFGTLRRLMDIGPQASTLLTVPVVLALVVLGRWGLQDLPVSPATILVGAAVIAAGWAAAVIWFTTENGILKDSLMPIDYVIRIVIAVGFIGSGIVALAGVGGIYGTAWLALKALVFGILVACGLWIRLATRHSAATLTAIVEDGATPEREEALDRQFRATTAPVAIVWAGIVLNIFLAVVKVPA